jgi:hypothetical protein
VDGGGAEEPRKSSRAGVIFFAGGGGDAVGSSKALRFLLLVEDLASALHNCSIDSLTGHGRGIA